MTRDLWKYCTTRHCADMLLSLNLLNPPDWPAEKKLACLYAVANDTERHYTRQQIPKRDGTSRQLLVPDPLLRGIQSAMLRGLLCWQPVSVHAAAYRPGRGILDGAAVHASQPLLLQLDIENFYDHILFPMIYQQAFPATIYSPQVRGLLTALCCHNDSLPQGAPTSPAISNLVLRPFDDYMGRWCDRQGIRYTRYCDDMTFSGDFSPATVYGKARGFLQEMGFSLNQKKCRVSRQGQRQAVTGIVVNRFPQVSRSCRRELRQEIHYCETFGVRSHLERLDGTPPDSQRVERYLQSLLGRICHVLYVHPGDSWFQAKKAAVSRLLKQETATE